MAAVAVVAVDAATSAAAAAAARIVAFAVEELVAAGCAGLLQQTDSQPAVAVAAAMPDSVTKLPLDCLDPNLSWSLL